MKKTLSIISAAILTVSCLPLTAANAADTPVSFYMKAAQSDKYELVSDDTAIYIPSEKLTEDVTVTASIYFADTQNGAWSVSPKWKSTDDEYVTITKVNNPFDTPTEPFAYSVKGEDGTLSTIGIGYDYSVNTKYNSCNFTVRSQDGMALTPYGSTSDAYPLISFEFTIDAGTPDGLYVIYFTEDADNSTRCAMDATQNHMIYSFPDCPPDVSGLTIRIGEPTPPSMGTGDNYLLGDVNEDGKVDSADASLVLSEYAAMSTGGKTTLTAQQAFNGDVNFDCSINSTDASDILAYYGYASTSSETPKSFLEYFNRTIPVGE